MPCPDLEQIERFAVGILVGEDTAVIERHVAECAGCRAQLDRVNAILNPARRVATGQLPHVEPKADPSQQAVGVELAPVAMPSSQAIGEGPGDLLTYARMNGLQITAKRLGPGASVNPENPDG